MIPGYSAADFNARSVEVCFTLFFKSSLEGRLRETLHKDYVKKLKNINIAYFQFSNIEAKAENT